MILIGENMSQFRPCCQELEAFSNIKSPFSKIIALGFYDGPTSGIAQCEICSTPYKFVMLDWDDNQEVRIFSLAPITLPAWNQMVNLLSKHESPKWPVWFPRWEFPSEIVRDNVDSETDKILASAGIPELVIASNRYGDQILAAKKLAYEDLEYVKDWFSLQPSDVIRDWFSCLGLTKEREEILAPLE